MSDDKWWGKPEEKESSKKTIEEMMNHTEMMKIRRDEEKAQAQHELDLAKLKGQKLEAETEKSINPAPRVNSSNGTFDWMTDDPGYLILAIVVLLGFIVSIATSALTPSVDEVWGTTNGVVLEGTEWWEDEIEYEDCLYDEYYDEYYDCIYTYSYDCGADVYYNYSINEAIYFGQHNDYFLGNWGDYCLEIVENETLPLNSSVEVWYKFDNNDISQLEPPSDTGAFFAFLGFCCLLPILIILLIFMYFDGNNEQYEDSDGSVHIHHHHSGGAIFGGTYYGVPWHRRPWFHRRRSRRISRRITSGRTSGGGRRSSGSGNRRSGGGSRRSGGGSRRSGGGSRRSGGGRRSR